MGFQTAAGQRRKRRQRPVAEINVVPYVDVMLVLLVIFMVSTPLLTQGIAVDLPAAQGTTIPTNQQPPLVVSVDGRGQYFLNVADQPEKPLTAAALAVRVAAEIKRDPTRRVLVKGDSQVDYGRVVQLMALLRQSGAPGVGLLTDPHAVQAASG